MYRSVALSSPVKGQRLAKTQEVRVKHVTLTYFYATQVIFQSQVLHAAEPFCSISLLIEPDVAPHLLICTREKY